MSRGLLFYLILTKMEEEIMRLENQVAKLNAKVAELGDKLEEEKKNAAFWRDRSQKLESRLTAIKSMVQGMVFFIE